VHFVPVADIEWIESAGVYAVLHVGDREILHRGSLAALAKVLAPSRFVRVHRSAIVNLARVRNIAHVDHGDFEATMISGAKVKISRNFRNAIRTEA